MKTADPDDNSLPDPRKTPKNYEKLEREAIQSESTAPESATKFPFGHNEDAKTGGRNVERRKGKNQGATARGEGLSSTES